MKARFGSLPKELLQLANRIVFEVLVRAVFREPDLGHKQVP